MKNTDLTKEIDLKCDRVMEDLKKAFPDYIQEDTNFFSRYGDGDRGGVSIRPQILYYNGISVIWIRVDISFYDNEPKEEIYERIRTSFPYEAFYDEDAYGYHYTKPQQDDTIWNISFFINPFELSKNWFNHTIPYK